MLFAAALLCAGTASGDVVNPWGLSAYTSGNIGTASSGFSGQFASGVMSGGSTYVNRISIGTTEKLAEASGASILAGGEVILSGWAAGNIDAGWNVSINGASVGGSVRSGNSLKTNGSGGSIAGDAILGGGNLAGYAVSIGGSVLQKQAYAASADIGGYGEFFRAVSSQAAASKATGKAWLQESELHIDTSGSGTQFVNVSSDDISKARTLSIAGSKDATVIVNVFGDAASFNNLGWTFSGGASAARTIFVFDSAFDVSVQGSVEATILANSALVRLSGGAVSGSVIGMGLIGDGSIGSSQFAGVIPAPGAGALACVAGAMCARRKRD
jgi:choice-of-anchor A domain-containing protein